MAVRIQTTAPTRTAKTARLVHVGSVVPSEAAATTGDPTRMVVTKVTCITHPKSTPSGSVLSTAGTARGSAGSGKPVPIAVDRALFDDPSQTGRI